MICSIIFFWTAVRTVRLLFEHFVKYMQCSQEHKKHTQIVHKSSFLNLKNWPAWRLFSLDLFKENIYCCVVLYAFDPWHLIGVQNPANCVSEKKKTNNFWRKQIIDLERKKKLKNILRTWWSDLYMLFDLYLIFPSKNKIKISELDNKWLNLSITWKLYCRLT